MSKLIRYVHNTKGQKIGVVVALDSECVGFSLCCKKDTFSKKKGVDLAVKRAEKILSTGKKIIPPYSVFIEYYGMMDRSYRYFNGRQE